MLPDRLPELWRRRVPQILAVYLGVAWAFVEVTDFMTTRYELSPVLVDLLIVVCALMLPSVALFAWVHGASGRQSWSRVEKIVVPANLAVTLLVSIAAFSGRDFHTAPPAPAETAERQVTFTSDITVVSMSPDGRMVAYLRPDPDHLVLGGKLFVQDLAGGDPLLLLDRTRALFARTRPRWTDDGSHVLIPGHPRGLLGVPRLGGVPRVHHKSGMWFYDVTADDRHVTGVRIESNTTPPDTSLGLYVGRANDELPDAGADLPGVLNVVPRDYPTIDGTLMDPGEHFTEIPTIEISPDGKWVAFIGRDSMQTGVLGIATLDGSVVRVLRELGVVSKPRWGASSETLYFLRPAVRGMELRRLSIDARNGRPRGPDILVVNGLPNIEDWDISSDGQRLVYAGGQTHRRIGLATLLPHDTIAQAGRLSNDSFWYDAPTFAPSGDSVAYVKDGGGSSGIYVGAVRGGAERRLTTARELNGAVQSMSWSPDGARLAVVLERGDRDRITLIDVRTGLQRPLWDAAADTSAIGIGVPAWSPDSRTLAVVIRGRQNLLMIDVAGGSASWLLPAPATTISDAVFSPDGSELAVHISGRFPNEALPDPPPPVVLYTINDGPVDTLSLAGVWIYSLRTKRFLRDLKVAGRPVIWTTTGVYTEHHTPPSLDVVSPRGTRLRRITLPFTCGLSAAIARDAGMLVCAIDETVSDVWVRDNFDRTIRR